MGVKNYKKYYADFADKVETLFYVEKEVTLESQANTFIERRFEVACSYLTGGSNILNEWRARKEEYISYTNSVE